MRGLRQGCCGFSGSGISGYVISPIAAIRQREFIFENSGEEQTVHIPVLEKGNQFFDGIVDALNRFGRDTFVPAVDYIRYCCCTDTGGLCNISNSNHNIFFAR